jgi:NADH-quinone oxidoreductase subunit B
VDVVPSASPRSAIRATDVGEVVLTTTMDKMLAWSSSNSIWPFGFGLACCAMEMIALVTPRYDIARFGAEVIRATPRQADLMIVSGRVAHRMSAPIRQLYEQMLEPKWVMAMGACSSTGGMFANYAVLQGVDKIVPVDVYVPGCPPRPEAVVDGILTLQRRIKAGIPPAYEQQRSQA